VAPAKDRSIGFESPQLHQEVRANGRELATDEVLAVADKLGAGVAKALLGKAVLPDDLPFVTAGSASLAPSRRGS
jgi:thiamine pyrophosphate-dependent acetolactate synthase large subunit-like protein